MSFATAGVQIVDSEDSEECLHLVVVAIGDGIGLNTSFLHLEEDLHRQDWLAVLSTQLQQHTVTHLGHTAALSLNKLELNYFIPTNIVNFSILTVNKTGAKKSTHTHTHTCKCCCSRFSPHLEPAASCPASSSARRTLCAAPEPWSGCCPQNPAGR